MLNKYTVKDYQVVVRVLKKVSFLCKYLSPQKEKVHSMHNCLKCMCIICENE